MATVDPSRPAGRRPTCLLCLQVIKAKERLVLHNSSSCHVIPVLEEFLCDFYPASTTVVLHAEASICRSCVRSLEKFHRLRKDLTKMKSEIRLKVDRLGERHELCRREADAGKASAQ